MKNRNIRSAPCNFPDSCATLSRDHIFARRQGFLKGNSYDGLALASWLKYLAQMKKSQDFGGPWSVFKVETVEAYLVAFNQALKNAGFRKVYIDAFAGSGSFAFGGKPQEKPSLFDVTRQHHAGSPVRALSVSPPFERLFFLERKRKNIAALRELLEANPEHRDRVEILPGDANEQIAKLCQTQDWRRTRGVIFLDPFGNSVKWSTLEAIARTKALDVWYLFPLLGVFRNAPIEHSALTADKRRTITEMLGTAEWESHFYREHADDAVLFPSLEKASSKRSINVSGMETFVQDRLQKVFPHVERPLTIRGTKNAPLFSLFFAVSSPQPRAQQIASGIARHLLKPQSRGTRPKSSR